MFSKPIQERMDYPFIAPLLIGVYPVLALLAENIIEIPFTDGVRALLVSFLASGNILLVVTLLIRNQKKASILTSLGVIIFFAYGHIYLFLERGGFLGLPLGRHRYLVPVTLAVFLSAVWGVWRTKRPLTRFISTLNLIAILLVLFPVLEIGYAGIRSATIQFENDPVPQGLPLVNGKNLPDIYYILLDGYPRSDILQSTFEYDNGEFLDFLMSRGFYLAHCSQSNYSLTISSMASALNLKYIHDETSHGIQLPDPVVMEKMIKNSQVQAYVESAGYTTVNFEMNYHWIKWIHADLYLSPLNSSVSQYMLHTGLNDFELLLVKTSAALIFFDMQVTSIDNQAVDLQTVLESNPRRVHRERLDFLFDTMMHIPDTVPSPKFVYAHIISPHSPYIFDAEGNFIEQEQPASEDMTAYRDQVIYLNSRVEAIVDALLTLSEQLPVIIIQSDHGALIDYQANNVNKYEKMANLSAFYFPGQDYSRLYPTITPVNIFRVVFDQFLGGNYMLLEDKSYYDNEIVQLHCSE